MPSMVLLRPAPFGGGVSLAVAPSPSIVPANAAGPALRAEGGGTTSGVAWPTRVWVMSARPPPPEAGTCSATGRVLSSRGFADAAGGGLISGVRTGAV